MEWAVAKGDERAKTPDELEADAKNAEQGSAAADRALEQSRIDQEHANDDQQMADSFYGGLAGATPSGGNVFGSDDDGGSTMSAGIGALFARARAKTARDTADWARKADALGLTPAGTGLPVPG